MKHALEKLKEAVKIRSNIAKQEKLFWDMIHEAVEELATENLGDEISHSDTHSSKNGGGIVYMTTIQAADYLGLSKGTLSKWRVTGEGPIYTKLGSSIRYTKEELDNYTKSRTYRHTSAYS